MRLLVVSQYFWPENFRINELVSDLCARGHVVTVLTGRPNYPEGRIFDDYLKDPAEFSNYAGARIVRVPLRPRGKGNARLVLNYLSFVLWGCLLGPWRLRGQRFDAIFVFEISPITSALPAIVIRRLKRAPLLMWVLDLWPETLSAIGVMKSARLLGWVGLLVSFIYKRCDRILAQSQAFFPNIERWSGDSMRTRYFPAWAEAIFEGELQLVAPAPEVPASSGSFNVMFAGNVGDAQDFPSILEAARRLAHRRDIRWLIVGDGRSAGQVRKAIDSLGLQDSVLMLGRHPLDRMPSFFRTADALLVSLKDEPIFNLTIPGKVQTYLASGKPVLGMLGGEGARVIAESGAGWVCGAGDGAGLAGLVERLAALSQDERSAMGRSGREYSRREFDRAELIGRLEGWLQEVKAECHG